MDNIGTALVYSVIIPTIFIAAMVIGYGIFTFLIRTVRPLEAWADKQIRQMEEWQDDEEEEF